MTASKIPSLSVVLESGGELHTKNVGKIYQRNGRRKTHCKSCIRDEIRKLYHISLTICKYEK